MWITETLAKNLPCVARVAEDEDLVKPWPRIKTAAMALLELETRTIR